MTGVVQRLRCPAALTMVCMLASCGSDASGPGMDTTGTNTAPRGLAVSAPVPAPVPGGGEPDGTVAFVSAFPGPVVRAATAQVVLGGTVVQPVPALDGGFDPVAVPARAGDQVRVVLTDSAGSTTSVTATVRSGTHPRVVRTSPAPRRTDVPLNAIIRVVFSTPMTLESVREGVRLTQAGARVAAEVEAGDASGVAYDLVPVEELVPATEYAIVIGAVVEDVNGVPLGEAVTAPFTTTSSSTPAAAAYVTLVNDLGWLDPEWEVPVSGEVAIYARALDANHSPINTEIAFSTEQPGLIELSVPRQTGRWFQTNVRGVGPGRATIVARAGNAVGSASLVVYKQVDWPTALAAARVVWVNDRLSDGRLLTSDVILVDAYSHSSLTASDPGLRHRAPTASVTGKIAFERAFMRGGTLDSVRIVIREPDGWEHLVPTGGNQYCPSWSPDGSRLVFTEYYRDTDGRLVTTLVVIDPAGTVQASWPGPSEQAEPCAGWALDGRRVGLFGAPAPVLQPGYPWVYPSLYELMTADSVRRFSSFVWSLDEGRWLSRGSGPGVELLDGKRSLDGRWVLVATGGGVGLVSRDRTLRAGFTSDPTQHSPSFAY